MLDTYVKYKNKYNKYGDDTDSQSTQDWYDGSAPIVDVMPDSTYSLDFYYDNFIVLPRNVDILRNIRELISSIKDETVKNSARRFALEIQTILLQIVSNRDVQNKLPPIHINELDDESVLFEWIFNDFRIGFSFEKQEEYSRWFFITGKGLNSADMTGHLSMEDAQPLIRNFIEFVLRYT